MRADFDLAHKRVWVAGETGMVGSAIVRALAGCGAQLVRPTTRLDLRRQAEVEDFVHDARPDAVFMAAARVGGILANASFPADFLYDNLLIEANVIHAAFRAQVSKLLFLGSTCIYPRDAAQPLQETALLTGPLEPTNQWYAVAKIAGIKLCQAYRAQHGMNFISVMPTNLYGPFDNFDLQSSHVLAALMRKIHDAKTNAAPSVTIWGSGTPRREFMHVDDLARALLFVMKHYDADAPLNVGTGVDCTIAELAARLARLIGYTGQFEYDASKPDGAPRKCTDIRRLRALGFSPNLDFDAGLEQTYRWYLAQRPSP
jgi:GDP-L-fucose synthase